MNKRNALIVALLLIIAVGTMLFLPMRQEKGSEPITESTVIITSAGKELMRVPLSRPQTVTVRTGDEENVLEITTDGVVMVSSTCQNQLCVNMGKVTEDNWEFRPNGAFIICLPNQVSAELVVVEK